MVFILLNFNPLIQGINPKGVYCNNNFFSYYFFGATIFLILATKNKRRILSQNPCSCNFHHIPTTFLVWVKTFANFLFFGHFLQTYHQLVLNLSWDAH
jgi:hypothetical protein